MMRRAVATIVCAGMMLREAPAFAEDAADASPPAPSAADRAPAEGDARESAHAKQRVFIYTSYGIAAVGLGLSFLFLAQANSAFADRRDIARQNGSEDHVAWKCYGEECARMKELREDQDTAKTWWAAATGIAIAGAVAGSVFLVAHLLDKPAAKRSSGPTLSPAVGPREAGLQISGAF